MAESDDVDVDLSGLQLRGWGKPRPATRPKKALDFEQKGKSPSSSATAAGEEDGATAGTSVQDSSSSVPEDPEPHRICLLSWNIDGLDANNTLTRTQAVCKLIIRENPDVVFLQEVIAATAQVIEKLCPQYKMVCAGKRGYFTAVLLRISSVVMKSYSVSPFFASRMGRNLLQVKATVKGLEMDLMTSHLESTGSHADERKRQLEKAFREVKDAPPSSTVVFGGDLNLRDKEQLGGVPEGIYDLWEMCGQQPEAKFTWDMMKNDNLEFDTQFRPRTRFDRLYLRQRFGSRALKPDSFE